MRDRRYLGVLGSIFVGVALNYGIDSLGPGVLRVFAANGAIIGQSLTTAPRAQTSPDRSPSKSSWSGQIAPILYRNCTTCHHPGGAGPFSLLTYEEARRWAPQILAVTQSRFMPPWLPEPGYGDLADSRRLSTRELALIHSWVDTGMQRGEATLAPQAPVYSSTWVLGKPDLVLTVPQPYTLAAGGEDVFRNFILPYPLGETHYIRAMQILPGAPSVVHHANVLIDRTAEYRHEHSDWQQGVPGMELVVDAGKSFDPDSHFLFWKPDTPALEEPAGMPWRLDPGNDLILNMHLKPSGKSEQVGVQIGLYFTDKPPTKIPMLLQLDRDDALDIPAGQSSFTVEDELTLPVDVDVLGIYPHAHYLGKDMKVWAISPGKQRKWLIWIRDWDIDRQSVYRYRQPVFLQKGTTLHMRYTYDNSASNPHNPHSPPVRVRAGNRSEDEMAHLWLQVLPAQPQERAPDPRLLLEDAWMRRRLRKVPNDYVSLYNLAAALEAEGKARESEDTFQQILKLKPDDGRSWNALGAVAEGAGDLEKARQSFSQALAVDAGNCDAHFNLAQLDLKQAKFAESEAGFRGFIADCTDDSDARGGLAQALIAEEKYDDAQEELLHALKLGPTTPQAADLHQHLAFAYVRGGKLDAGISQLREAVKLMPTQASAHALLAQVLAQTNQFGEAILEEKAALHLHEDADGWNNLGVFEARSGDTEGARHAFEQAQRIDPSNSQARDNLARLHTQP